MVDAQISAVTPTESGGPLGPLSSQVTTTISGLEVLTLTNPAGATAANFNSGCSAEAVFSFEICNIQESGTITFGFRPDVFNLVDAGTFVFSGGPIFNNIVQYTADFEPTTLDLNTGEVTCTTLSISIAIIPGFSNPFIDDFSVIDAGLNSSFNPMMQLSLPAIRLDRAFTIGQIGGTTL